MVGGVGRGGVISMDLLEKLKLQIMPIRLKYKRQPLVLNFFFLISFTFL